MEWLWGGVGVWSCISYSCSETKRNETKQNKTKRNETKRNEKTEGKTEGKTEEQTEEETEKIILRRIFLLVQQGVYLYIRYVGVD